MIPPTCNSLVQRRSKAQNGEGRCKSKPLRSRHLEHGNDKNKREIEQLPKEATKQVLTDHFEDHLKLPGGSGKAHSAKTAHPSFNIYFGRNAGEERNGVVERCAHGTGTGTSTIGLDPHTMRFNHCLPAFDRILDKIPGVKKEEKKAVTVASAKLHCAVGKGVKARRAKSTGRHTDVLFDSRDKPSKGNSQVPGSPVVMCTFGGRKHLHFTQGECKSRIREGVEFPFVQNDNCGFHLDGADENPNDEKLRWLHRSKMHPDNRKGMVISSMFRQVRSVVKVNVKDGTLAHSGEDKRVFSSVRQTHQNNDDHKSAMEEINAKAKELMTRKIH